MHRRSCFIIPSKEHLRKKFQHLRSQITTDDQMRAAVSAADIIKKQKPFESSKNIACYLPFRNEFPTEPLIDLIWREHKKCFLPKLKDDKSLRFASFKEEDDLQANRFGILEPVDTALLSPEQLDIVLIPLLAFSDEGHRLGTGGGYYDRTFSFLKNASANKPLLWGLGFELQRTTHLLADEWDIKLDGALTERDFYSYKEKR